MNFATATAIETAKLTLSRATERMEAKHGSREDYLVSVANYNAAFDALELLKASTRPAPRF